MVRNSILAVGLAILTACGGIGSEAPRLGPDGKPLPQLYRISAFEAPRVQFRLLDGLNSLRKVSGVDPVEMNAALNAAAATHARDMSVQNRAWHFGSDGSSPLDRIGRVGYTGQLLGENISETYETELQTLAVWMESEATRNVMMDPRATDLGFSWHQDPSGKIWWVLVMGKSASNEVVAAPLGNPDQG